MNQEVIKCPRCSEGYAGADSTGEAVDCRYCDGHGNITAEMFVNLQDKVEELVGDAMTTEAYLMDAETRAISSMAANKWLMFGYWAAMVVHLRKILGKTHTASPFREFADLARQKMKGQ